MGPSRKTKAGSCSIADNKINKKPAGWQVFK